MLLKTLCASIFTASLIVGSVSMASAQSTPNSHNNSTSGSPSGDSSGNAATGSGAAPSGK